AKVCAKVVVAAAFIGFATDTRNRFRYTDSGASDSITFSIEPGIKSPEFLGYMVCGLLQKILHSPLSIRSSSCPPHTN
ncbi:hypothetical protein, partial [Fibrobacter sp. UBA3718]|uniref:hypothetical protein n=1 Tax=Fibrobacter sp. UBA3718 TaxID=1946531 RepID=UPI0025C14D6D